MKKRILAIVIGTAMTLSKVRRGAPNEETPATTPDTKPPPPPTHKPPPPPQTPTPHNHTQPLSLRSDRKEFPVYILAGSC